LGPISPITSCLCTSMSTLRSACTPSKARETPVARRLPPGHRLASRETSSANASQVVPSFFVV
jgi:hypothetical protein